MRGWRRLILLFFSMVLSACAPSALNRSSDDGFDGKPWEIQRAELPRYPRNENLIQIYVSPTTTFRFFVDPGSVSVSEDGPIRYTLVARSPSGATNVSYEGIRCETRERKLYAFGTDDGTWIQARSSRWVSISEDAANRQQAALADDFFCPERGRVRTTEEAVSVLKQGAYSGVAR